MLAYNVVELTAFCLACSRLILRRGVRPAAILPSRNPRNAAAPALSRRSYPPVSMTGIGGGPFV